MLRKEYSKAIDIGGTSFGGEDDIEIWVGKYLPPTNLFGWFVNIYSFLNRILASNNGIGSLVDLVTNSRLEIGSDEAVSIYVNIKQFGHHLGIFLIIYARLNIFRVRTIACSILHSPLYCFI